MKYLIFISAILIFSSCKKDNINTNQPIHPYLSSIKYYSNRVLLIDSFLYDSRMRLTNFIQHKYDSSGTSVIQGRLAASFQYNLNENIPQSYVFDGLPQIETHLLSFDSRNRIIKDTSLNGTHNVVYYSYSDAGFFSTFLFGGDFLYRQLDSISISNENIIEEKVYYSNGSPTAEFSGSIQSEYASLSNPVYQPAITLTIGPLLHILTYDGFGGLNDFTSKNLFRKIIIRTPANPAIERNYIWNTDSNGNVITGTISGAPQNYIEFNYY